MVLGSRAGGTGNSQRRPVWEVTPAWLSLAAVAVVGPSRPPTSSVLMGCVHFGETAPDLTVPLSPWFSLA